MLMLNRFNNKKIKVLTNQFKSIVLFSGIINE